jgi:periplasmic divalent cation tolerance protein
VEKKDLVLVLISSATEAEAERLRDVLLDGRQAACVNIIPGVNSAYWWKGRVEAAEECLVIAKTKASQLHKIVETVKHHHGYSVPEIIATPIVGGNPDYLAWIDAEVSD